MLTKQAITKGTPAEFSLVKSELANLIPSGHYFKDTANWKTVVIHYQSPGSHKQSITVSMDAGLVTPIGDFKISEKALDQFEVKYVTIYDFDGGKYLIKRESLPVAEFDVAIAAVVSALLSRDYSGRSGLIADESGSNGFITFDGTNIQIVADDINMQSIYQINPVGFAIETNSRYRVRLANHSLSGLTPDIRLGGWHVANPAADIVTSAGYTDYFITVGSQVYNSYLYIQVDAQMGEADPMDPMSTGYLGPTNLSFSSLEITKV